MPAEPDATATALPARRKTKRPSLPPGLLTREQAARYCGRGVSTWDKDTAAGLNPPPIALGGAKLWSRPELAEWIRHRCPPRTQWVPIWNKMLATRRAGRGRR